MSQGVLYISYSGMLEPLGQSQVLSYQERLAPLHPVHLVSFERPEDWRDEVQRKAVADRMQQAGIHWHPLTYHKRPSALATAWDIACGTATGLWLIHRHGLKVVHARSYVASVMALGIKHLSGAAYIFDMRGFWADERIDGELWPRDGRMYRVAKWFERRFLLAADHVVSLTHAAAREIKTFPYLQGRMPPSTVIPTCADLKRFKPTRQKLAHEPFVLGYVGSAGTWYLFEEVAACFKELKLMRPDARLLVINRLDHSYIQQQLKNAGIPDDAVDVTASSHADVPQQMARMHAGVFFYRPSYSRLACAPTKLGEFLGCGIPCISNAGVGDMASILTGHEVGVVIEEFTPDALRKGLRQLLELVAEPSTAKWCIDAAHQHFSLDEGVKRYAEVYTQIRADR